jgi:hypothetical protein
VKNYTTSTTDRIKATTAYSTVGHTTNRPLDEPSIYDNLSVSARACVCVTSIHFQPNDRYNYSKLLQMGQLTDFSDVVDLMTFPPSLLNSSGVQFGELMEGCVFDRSDCTEQWKWRTSLSRRYGLCYTFLMGSDGT